MIIDIADGKNGKMFNYINDNILNFIKYYVKDEVMNERIDIAEISSGDDNEKTLSFRTFAELAENRQPPIVRQKSFEWYIVQNFTRIAGIQSIVP